MPIYVKYGTTIKGESTAEGYKGADGWFEVGSFQWGAGRGISTPVGSSSKREASAPSISEITVTKSMDSTGPLLLQEALRGKGEAVELQFVTTSGAQLEVYLTIKLTNCMVSGYSVSTGGDRPSESLSLNFTKIEYSYQGFDDQAKPDTAKKQACIYDLAAAKTG